VFVLAAAAVVELTISYGRVPWLALLIAATWTIYGYLKKGLPITPLESMAAESFIVLVPAIVVVVVMSGNANSVPRTASAAQLALVLCSGLATIIPLTLFAFAAQRVPLTVIAPLNYINPTINFFLGWLVFHEALPASRVVGFVVVWIGLVMATIDAARRSRRKAMTAAEPVPV
jgi:chloramphenicol-sensitive protein RarD